VIAFRNFLGSRTIVKALYTRILFQIKIWVNEIELMPRSGRLDVIGQFSTPSTPGPIPAFTLASSGHDLLAMKPS